MRANADKVSSALPQSLSDFPKEKCLVVQTIERGRGRSERENKPAGVAFFVSGSHGVEGYNLIACVFFFSILIWLSIVYFR